MLKEHKDEASLKAAGKVMTKGKDYSEQSYDRLLLLCINEDGMLTSKPVVADGDIILSTYIWYLQVVSQSLTRSQSKPALQSHDRAAPHAGRAAPFSIWGLPVGLGLVT